MSAKIHGFIRHNVLGMVAIFIALGGTAYATHPGGEKTISSGDIQDDEVYSADVRNASLPGGGLQATDLAAASVGSNEIASGAVTTPDIAPNGVQGSRIAPNAITGPKVADGSLTAGDVGVFWAAVNSDGTVIRSSGGVTATRPATGSYRVDFNRDIRNCAHVAMPKSGAGDVAGGPIAAPPGQPVEVVAILMQNANGAANAEFSLVVAC